MDAVGGVSCEPPEQLKHHNQPDAEAAYTDEEPTLTPALPTQLFLLG
eukprot:CAMPEP_0115867476 /NCGR_PEP_ID=MMETSP0287-20121206/20787_1 /TAXON_ID=412157 /ORGANISM="Chrysochromulina rotalis, Strain UIO044" /LENGTH=46 /DNA_ID= /DNA_START= /DNA_END= /DNA_ORIENTATION=